MEILERKVEEEECDLYHMESSVSRPVRCGIG